MRFSGRFRFTIMTAMIVIALAAFMLSQYLDAVRRQQAAALAARRRAHLAQLSAELFRYKDRLEWSKAMTKKGYVSEAQIASDQVRVDAIRSQIAKLKSLLK